MSEPVSNAEIEDVLSSIRRLVSGEVDAKNDASASAEQAKEPVAKLILTADFRVRDADGTPSDPALELAGVTQEEPTESENETGELEGASGEANIQDAVEELLEAELTSPEPAHAEDDVHIEPDQKPDFEPNAEHDIKPGGETLDNLETSAQTDPEPGISSHINLESTIADLESAVAAQAGEWEPDGSSFEEDPDAEEPMTKPMQNWIEGTAQELEPDAAEAVDAVVDDTDQTDEDADLFGEEESVIDEETLRDMVSEIVRQELQGALGERITRNVRKLVRREINRVLAARDFE